MSGPDFMTDETYTDPGYQARRASGYLTHPPARYRDPEPPVDWPPGPPPVRCIECAHSKAMKLGFCSVAGKRTSGVAHWRRCGSFEARPAAGKERPADAPERPVEAPPMPELPTLSLHPAMRLRATLVDQGAIHRLAELTALDGGRVGVRLAPDLTDGEVLDTLRWIAWILRSDR
ncbi:hypothetical protein [Thiocapsa bogorovii]|uniref:hypothetical protein n=1 Tax=Thiocapsa bogorovii TaxID=521689 RepID=UPI001E4BD41D|nr:hypothetical protein [Thiocapsa bogorovii]UHD18574.1 hypothetical protein LT988_11315 [Thiocapsa bogorovii]